ncbi:MAG: hypothetical protein WD273_12235 [Trueperaceae bacterium]
MGLDIMFHRPDVAKGGLRLGFSSLDGGGNLEAVYTIGWRIKDRRDEAWTQRFSAAKFGPNQEHHVRAAARLAAESFDLRRFERPLVIPGVGSGDSRADDEGLIGQVAQSIASTYRDPVYRSDILGHHPHPSLKTTFGRDARREAVDGSFYLYDPYEDLEGVSAVLVDDFVTNADTLGDMARALNTSSRPPRRIIGVCLAKNESVAYAASQLFELNNLHLPERFAELWDGTR